MINDEIHVIVVVCILFLIFQICDQALKNTDIRYSCVYEDCKNAIADAHLSGYLHKTIMEDLDKYLPNKGRLGDLLDELKDNGKSLFILTNSPFRFVDCGMKHLVGQDWRQLFDVIIVNAGKPEFFQNNGRPFRKIDPQTCKPTVDKVRSFERHGVYSEGDINGLTLHTGNNWKSGSVLYFGDHVFSDLMDPVMRSGWRTGAVIHELEREIELSNDPAFQSKVVWLSVLEELITSIQARKHEPDIHALETRWREQRQILRSDLKNAFNLQFGSVFRTYHNRSNFCGRLTRYADIYTASMDNLLQYCQSHIFYPRRNALPHELH